MRHHCPAAITLWQAEKNEAEEFSSPGLAAHLRMLTTNLEVNKSPDHTALRERHRVGCHLCDLLASEPLELRLIDGSVRDRCAGTAAPQPVVG